MRIFQDNESNVKEDLSDDLATLLISPCPHERRFMLRRVRPWPAFFMIVGPFALIFIISLWKSGSSYTDYRGSASDSWPDSMKQKAAEASTCQLALDPLPDDNWRVTVLLSPTCRQTYVKVIGVVEPHYRFVFSPSLLTGDKPAVQTILNLHGSDFRLCALSGTDANVLQSKGEELYAKWPLVKDANCVSKPERAS